MIAPTARYGDSGIRRRSGQEESAPAFTSAPLARVRSPVVGHDIGLMVAYSYPQYPAEVEKIVLMEPPPGRGAVGGGLRRSALCIRSTADAGSPGTGTRAMLLRHFWNDLRPKEHSIRSGAESYTAPSATGTHAGRWAYLSRFRSREGFADCPGTGSEYGPRDRRRKALGEVLGQGRNGRSTSRSAAENGTWGLVGRR